VHQVLQDAHVPLSALEVELSAHDSVTDEQARKDITREDVNLSGVLLPASEGRNVLEKLVEQVRCWARGGRSVACVLAASDHGSAHFLTLPCGFPRQILPFRNERSVAEAAARSILRCASRTSTGSEAFFALSTLFASVKGGVGVGDGCCIGAAQPL